MKEADFARAVTASAIRRFRDEDAAQDAIVELLPRYRGGAFEGKGDGYLAKSAKHSALASLRKEKRETFVGVAPVTSDSTGHPDAPEDVDVWSEEPVAERWRYLPPWLDRDTGKSYGPKNKGAWLQMWSAWRNDLWRPPGWDYQSFSVPVVAARTQKRIDRDRHRGRAWEDAEEHDRAVNEERTRNTGALRAIEELSRLRVLAAKAGTPTAGQLGSWWTDIEPILGWMPARIALRLELECSLDFGRDGTGLPELLEEAAAAIRVRWLPNVTLGRKDRQDTHLHRDLVAAHLAGAGWTWVLVGKAQRLRPLSVLRGASTATLRAAVTTHRARTKTMGATT